MGRRRGGNWYRRSNRKTTVEQCLSLEMRHLRRVLHPGSAGLFTWKLAGGDESSVRYSVTISHGKPTVTLNYRWRDTEMVQMTVRLEQTLTQFGGRRWWFLCPLIRDGVPCNRRVSKLFSPPGARYFGCRQCHDLTYRSSQESHLEERGLARLAKVMEKLQEG